MAAILYKDTVYGAGGGGGGGASALTDLTDVDLSNLSDGQIIKYDATNQKWVNDDESGGLSELNYSTEEQKIGKWIDGKPLYQKTVTIQNNVAWSNNSTFDLNISNPDTIWVYDGFIYDGRSNAMTNHTNPIIQSNDRGAFNINLSNKSQLKFVTSATFSSNANRYAVITVRYTKTTD